MIAGLPVDAVVCVFHSSFWHQVADADRGRIDDSIAAAAQQRPIVRVALESRGGATNELRVGLRQERLLAQAHPHGLRIDVTP